MKIPLENYLGDLWLTSQELAAVQRYLDDKTVGNDRKLMRRLLCRLFNAAKGKLGEARQ